MRFSPSTKSFYPEAITYPDLPLDLVDVSDEQHAAVINRPAGYSFDYQDGEFVILAPPAPALADLKAAKLSELAADFTAAMASIRAGYPADEIQSWDEQKAEASAYAASTTASIPLLSAMAKARGIDLAVLVARVLANAAAWSAASGALIGKRQAYEDQLDKANDPGAVAEIVWTN